MRKVRPGLTAAGAGMAGDRVVAAGSTARILVAAIAQYPRRGIRGRYRPLAGAAAAYRSFLADRLAPGAPVLMLRDTRTWPVVDAADGHSFQLGCPASGLNPVDFHPDSHALRQVLRSAGGDSERWEPPEISAPPAAAEHGVESGFDRGVRDWTSRHGHPLHQILVPTPAALSAATADLYRRWLRAAGKTGDRLVVECGRLLDPWQVLRAGLVPYWCENATRRSVEQVEWWLAGSESFTSVDVLPSRPAYAHRRWPACRSGWRSAPSTAPRRAAIRSPRCPPAEPLRCSAPSRTICPVRRRWTPARHWPRCATAAATTAC